MKRSTILTILCTLAFGVSASFAEVYPHDEAGVSVTIPDNWDVDTEEDNVLFAKSPDEKVFLIFFVIDAGDEEAGEAIAEMIGEEISDIEDAGEEKETKLKGGFIATENASTGFIEDIGKVELGTLQFENNGKEILILGGLSSEAESKFEEDISKIIDSLKKIQ